MSYLNGKHIIRQELDQSHSNTTSDDYDGDDDDGGLVNIDDDGVDDTGNKDSLWLGIVEKLEERSSLLRHSFPSKAGRTPVNHFFSQLLDLSNFVVR